LFGGPSEPGSLFLGPNKAREQLPGKSLTVTDLPDRRSAFRHKGLPLANRTFDLVRRIDQWRDHRELAAGEALKLCRNCLDKFTKLPKAEIVDAMIDWLTIPVRALVSTVETTQRLRPALSCTPSGRSATRPASLH
jgi:hypothetical protein